MKKILFLMSLLFLHFTFAQKIIVNGKESNGKLSWDDYTGKVDEKSNFDSGTYYKYHYDYQIKKAGRKNIVVYQMNIILSLDEEKSWIKMTKATDELLSHEQGHFNLGILEVREIEKMILNKKFDKKTYQSDIKNIIDQIDYKYKKENERYDKETEHYVNKKAQEEWILFFKKQLPDLYH